ncbi:hypothetical protein OEZ49_21665 [Ruegeria sp. WL0004]|uniref:Uncharacterized protein n=1 Tax=Ruegeria marisflavi TaxID=2984152 RepID=A0ABT2WWT5_9RHOB|nr:hypothetical protein [Ruegeria sp. WL0004]MCU9840366.1 hypothetical protein [Ruegeria sp. WL0004]
MGNIGAELRLILDRLRTVVEMDTTPGYWVGDTEAERRKAIDLRTGHHLARQAAQTARRGLDLWDAGDAEGAAECLDEVIGMLGYLRRAGVDLDGKPTYGRPPSDRDAQFAKLVDAKRAATGAGLTDSLFAVLGENPDVARRFVTRDPESLAKAYRRGRKALAGFSSLSAGK